MRSLDSLFLPSLPARDMAPTARPMATRAAAKTNSFPGELLANPPRSLAKLTGTGAFVGVGRITAWRSSATDRQRESGRRLSALAIVAASSSGTGMSLAWRIATPAAGLGNVSSFDRGKYLAVILARDRRAQVNNVIEDCAQRVDISRHGRALSRNLLRGCKCWGGVKHVYAVWTRCAFAQNRFVQPNGPWMSGCHHSAPLLLRLVALPRA